MRMTGVLTVIALGMMLATARAETFNVKTGLWQMDITSEATGAPPIPPSMMANMTPDQRQRLQAAMAANMNHPTQHTYKRCLTQKDLDEGFKMPERPGCTSTVLSKSSSGEKAKMDCANQMGKMTTLINWHIVDRENADGTTDTTITGNNGQSMKSSGKIKAKWLSANCGSEQ